MKALKIIGNIFGIFFAIVFSIALVLVLVAIPPVKSLSSVFQADTIQTMVVDVVGSEMVEAGSVMADGFEEAGISNEIVQELMESDAAEELISVYLNDVFSAAEGEDVESSLTQELLEDIVNDNKKELIPLVEEYADVEDEEEAEELLDMLVEEHGEDIIGVLPSVEENMLSVPSSSDDGIFSAWNVIRGLYSGTVIWIMIGVAAVLCLLIFLCRWFKLQGFMWIGVSCAVAAVLSALVIMLAGNMNLLMNMGLGQMERAMFASLIPNMMSAMVTATLVIAALAVVFIVVYIVGKTCMKKKAQRAL